MANLWELIQHFDESGEEIVHREPPEGSARQVIPWRSARTVTKRHSAGLENVE